MSPCSSPAPAPVSSPRALSPRPHASPDQRIDADLQRAIAAAEMMQQAADAARTRRKRQQAERQLTARSHEAGGAVPAAAAPARQAAPAIALPPSRFSDSGSESSRGSASDRSELSWPPRPDAPSPRLPVLSSRWSDSSGSVDSTRQSFGDFARNSPRSEGDSFGSDGGSVEIVCAQRAQRAPAAGLLVPISRTNSSQSALSSAAPTTPQSATLPGVGVPWLARHDKAERRYSPPPLQLD